VPSPQVDTQSHFNLRVGASTNADYERASICLEVTVWRKLSVEGCGNGSGILHKSDGGELAHFRAKWALWNASVSRGNVVLQGGLGFAELQVGADEPGFEFGVPSGESAAGAEGSLSLQYFAPVGKGFEFIASSAIGMAYIRGANALPTAPSKAQPFASFELGIGW
tara:strand:+ start:1791 stop:2288 length:498 start_codon:yes stop_codon:yes gene_type:complete